MDQSYNPILVQQRPVKAVMLDVPRELLEQRRKIGGDQWDEVWDRVLHMVPSPTVRHQDLEWLLETWLRQFWAPSCKGRVYHQVNVALPGAGPEWVHDFRIPDLVLLTPSRFAIDQDAYFAGGPDAVVEIRTPGDETCDKIPFYAAAGVRELWVVDRDTRAVEIHGLAPGRAAARAEPDAGGWLRSALGVCLRAEPGHLLAMQLEDDSSTLRKLP
jgi:Uma2 family endonuclease